MIGRTLQHYRIEELLGEGGMGTVYRATDTLLQRPVAIKTLHAHLLRDSSFMERFRNEAVLSAQLNHPNVTALYSLVQDQNDKLMVMEYVDGLTLEQVVKKQGALSVEIAVGIIVQALDGLHHAHKRGILHRDLKPANLMITREGTVKLMDFGIARMMGSTRITRANRVVGTLEYMAPELLDQAEPSIPSDLYAIGVLLYELLSGKMPFEATTDATLISQILNKNPIPIRSRVSHLPKGLEDILAKLLHKKPEKRYASAHEVRQALLAVVIPVTSLSSIFEASAKNIPKTRLADVTDTKPQASPTRLATEAHSKPSLTNTLKSNLLSFEGMILIGALVIVIAILGIWALYLKPSPSNEASATGTHDSLSISSSAIQAPTKDSLTSVAVAQNRLPQSEPVVLPKENIITPIEPKKEPEKPRSDKPKEKQPETPRTEKPKENQPETLRSDKPKENTSSESPTPVIEKPKVTDNPPPKENATPKTSRTVTIDLGNEAVVAEFAQTVSSDDAAGTVVWLKAVSMLRLDGVTIIEPGAKIRARIIESRTATDAKKAFLALKFEAVEATNGQWIGLRYPEYSDKSSTRVVFAAGRRINNLRTERTKLTFSL
ncbi:MAG: protein kinase domain-containing protein [Runella sp.]